MIWLALLGSKIDLDEICRKAVEETLAIHSQVKPDDVGLAVILMERGKPGRLSGGFRADASMYPASVVKTFYLAYGAHLVSAGRLKPTEEDQRAFTDMIKDSSNDATGHVLDVLTKTTGGPELAPAALKTWMSKRQAVNRWLAGLGYTGVNACQKTWNEGPYGRERQGYGPNRELRNDATAASCARLMADIAQERLAGPKETEWMLGLLKRDLNDMDAQTKSFIGGILPKNLSCHSKAGFAYQVRHDLALIRHPDGRDVVLCIFTDHHATNLNLVPDLALAMAGKVGLL